MTLRLGHGHRRSGRRAHAAPSSWLVTGHCPSRAVVLVATTALLPLGAGVAYGLWSASGSGDGAGKAQTAQALTVTAGTARAQLYPGATGDAVFDVTNPNAYAVTVDSGTLSSVTATSDAGCGVDQFSLSAGTVASTAIAAGASATVTVAGALTMASTAPDACQGVTVTVSGTLSGTQS
jgi:hypothetical protein